MDAQGGVVRLHRPAGMANKVSLAFNWERNFALERLQPAGYQVGYEHSQGD